MAFSLYDRSMPHWFYPVRDALQAVLVLTQILGALIAMCVPFVAAGGAAVAWFSYRQRRIADNRAEWWRRASYALDLTKTLEPELGRNTGMELLTALQADETVGQTERDLLKSATSVLLAEIVRTDPGIAEATAADATVTPPPRQEVP